MEISPHEHDEQHKEEQIADSMMINEEITNENHMMIGRRKMNNFKLIPQEVILQFFCYLSEGKDFGALAMTCKLCYEIFDEEMAMSLDRIRLDYLNGVNRGNRYESRLIELFSYCHQGSSEKTTIDYDTYFKLKGELYNNYLIDKIPKCTKREDTGDEFEEEDFLRDMDDCIPIHTKDEEENNTPKQDNKGDYHHSEKNSNNFNFPHVNTLKQFKARLSEILKQNEMARIVLECLSNFNSTTQSKIRFIIAGGFVTHLVSNCGCCDIDIFTISNGSSNENIDQSLKQVLGEIAQELKKKKVDYNLLKTDGTLNLLPITNGERSNLCHRYPDANPIDHEQIPCQFILRRVQSIEELMCFFDIDCCRFCYDFETVYTILEGLRSMKFNINFVARQHIHTGMYVDRAIKYYRRGFSTLCVDLHPFEHKLHAQPFITWLREFFATHYIGLDGEGNYSDEYFNDEDWNYFNSLAPYMYFDKYSKGDTCDLDETNYYTIVLRSLDYWLVKCVLDTNLRDALYSFYTNGEYRDGRWTESFKDIPIESQSEPDQTIELILKHIQNYDIHYFCYNIEELLIKNPSMYITEGYLDSHLKEKYKFNRCYLCNNYYNGDFNSICNQCKKWHKGMQNMHRDLSGKVAIVTGGRCKIGYETSLLLLRMKAIVVVTTRFAYNALYKFKKEIDYDQWKDNLIIYPLNLKLGSAVVQFTEFVKSKFKHVDILVNNAAQTVRRPVSYFTPLVEKEKLLSQNDVLPLSVSNNCTGNEDQDTNSISLKDLSNGLVNNALNATLEILTPEDSTYKFSRELDSFGECIDSRKTHTWNMALNETSTVEIIECQMVNSIAPTLLISKLSEIMKPQFTDEELMNLDFENYSPYSYVVNVTSHEGTFNTTGKTDFHIQTNLSKASINMLTRSASNQLAKQGILMNSVDVGWISSSIPTYKNPPLKCKDGAYRILHPILTNSTLYGKLFKDYKIVVDW